MASYYWIKLYHEILDDPKMGVMPDNVWRRCIELNLLAGKLQTDGQLPDTKTISWYLHQLNEDALKQELEYLRDSGIIKENESGWLIVDFSIRQAWSASSNLESGYIYLMKRPGDGATKIGLSRQPNARLLQIREEFPSTVLLYTWKVNNMQFAEAALHGMYQEKRLDGEWFNLNDNDIFEISQLKFQDNEWVSKYY